MTRHDPIKRADLAEEEAAMFAMRATQTQDELTAVWWRDCDHFAGAARARLSDEFAINLKRLGAMQP